MRKAAIGIILFFSIGSLPAAEIPLDSEIDRVTISPGGVATVERKAELRIPAGKHVLRLDDLPGNADAASLQVQLGDTQVRLGTVDAARVTMTELTAERERALEQQLFELKNEQQALSDRQSALNTRLNFIENLAALPSKAGPALLEQAGDPTGWAAMWEAIGQGAEQTRSAMRAAALGLADVERQIKKVQTDLAQIRTGQRALLRAQIQVSAAADTQTDIRVSYRVRGVSWQPRYEARLDTDARTVNLSQMAEVRQKTGEDWSDVILTLSSTQPQYSHPPELPDIWWLDYQVERPPMPVAKTAALERLAPEQDMATQVIDTGFGVNYQAPTRVSVAANNQPQRLELQNHQWPVALRVRIIPTIAAEPWIVAESQSVLETELPAGPIHKYRDGAFVGQSHLALWAPGETRGLYFGVDPRVEVTRRRLQDLSGQRGVFNKQKRVEHHYETKVVNRHAEPIDITVVDRRPVPRNEEISVSLWDQGTPPSRKDVDNRPGVYAWDWKAQAGQERIVNFGYTVTYPVDRVVPGF